jgi:hypothetical protein
MLLFQFAMVRSLVMQNTPAEGELAIPSFVCSRPLPMITQALKFFFILKFETRGTAIDCKRHG